METMYPAYKVTRALVVLAPLMLLSVTLLRLAPTRRFNTGVELAVVGTGTLALIQFTLNFEHFRTGIDDAGVTTEVLFSRISLSILILTLQSVATFWFCRRPTWRRALLFVAMTGVCLFVCYLLSQRTALALYAFLLALMMYRLAPGPVSGATLSALGVLGGLNVVYSLVFGTGALSRALSTYARAFGRLQRMFDLSDHSYEIRTDAIAFCMSRGLDQPWTGHGLGSFLRYSGAHYPHNIIAEAFFEQGVPGLAAMIVLVALSTWAVLRLVRSARGDLALTGLVINWTYALKANSMVEFGMVTFWLALAVGLAALPKNGRGRHLSGPM